MSVNRKGIKTCLRHFIFKTTIFNYTLCVCKYKIQSNGQHWNRLSKARKQSYGDQRVRGCYTHMKNNCLYKKANNVGIGRKQ